MNRAIFLCAATVLILSCSAVQADLASAFDGYTTAWEVGVSGLVSSYHAPTKSGNTLPNYMSTLGPGNVTYPYGIEQVPSPGGVVGTHFDEGALGVKVQGGNLLIKVAGGLNPLTGWYYSGWDTWYGQGDVFVAVQDSTGISHFALLNDWATSPTGGYRTLNGGHFDRAQEFHTGIDNPSTSFAPTLGDLQGHLVGLTQTSDVVLAGGTGAYSPGYSPAPVGLDYRVYTQGGTDIGDAALTHAQTTDAGQAWYIQTWTVPLSWLSSDSVPFQIGLHKAASCGNDQIGLQATVPLPAAALLGMLGLGVAGLRLRRFA